MIMILFVTGDECRDILAAKSVSPPHTEDNINEDNISPLDKLYNGINVLSSV